MDTYAVLLIIAGIVAMDTTSGPQMLISEPVVSCSLLGILFNMPETGLVMGILFQLLWLGYMPLGAARLVDGNMAAFISTAGLITASRTFGIESDVLKALVVPAMLFGVITGKVGLFLTQAVRKLNGRRNDTLCSQLEKGKMVSITAGHLLGMCTSFSRGVLMAVILIPIGALLFGCIRFLPLQLISALAISSLLIWGTVAASALVFFWLKGRKRLFVLGSIGGIIWILFLTL